jgi:hypothetical protein
MPSEALIVADRPAGRHPVRGPGPPIRGIDQLILTRPDDRDERLRAIEGRLKG